MTMEVMEQKTMLHPCIRNAWMEIYEKHKKQFLTRVVESELKCQTVSFLNFPNLTP